MLFKTVYNQHKKYKDFKATFQASYIANRLEDYETVSGNDIFCNFSSDFEIGTVRNTKRDIVEKTVRLSFE